MRDAASITGARRAELILREVESLPTLPSVATRLMKVSSGDDADLQEIIKLIEMDPVLTARILSMCRRADMGVAARVTSVERAVILLGLETVQSLVLGVQVFQWSTDVTGGRTPSPDGAPPGVGFDRVGFWRHSIAVACCAEMIASRNRDYGVPAGEAFVAGLLHDLGKLVLSIVLPQAYQRVVELSDQRLANVADVEQSVIGLDHHVAGKRLAERWELPPVLRDVIWLHGQRPDAIPEGPHRKLIGLVHVADGVCRGLHLGWSGNHTAVEPLREACRGLRLDTGKIEQGMPDLLQSVSSRCADLGLSDDPSERMVLDALAAANRQLSRLGESANRRARVAQETTRVLEEVGLFLSSLRPGGAPEEVIGSIAASASRMFGPGRLVGVIQPRGQNGREPVQGPIVVAVHEGDGTRISCDIVELPDDAGSEPRGNASAPLSLAGLRSIVAARMVLDSPGAAVVHLLPRPGGVQEGDGSGGAGAAVVLHDREEASARLGPRLLGLVSNVWSSALSAAMREESSNHATEELASINQRLAHAEKQLAEAESMARLAELTAGAAHEFNNPLAIIAGRGQLLEMSVKDATQKSAASAIVQAAGALSDLVGRLHVIARPPEPAFAPTDVLEVLTEAISRTSERATRKAGQKKPAPMQATVAEGLGFARLDRELFTQALVEVLVNAVESEPSDFIVIRVQTDPVDDRLLIQVTDTGRGMTEHARKHATDPFFSEKPAGRQPGLGLALAHRLIGLHQGVISIDSTPGNGTIVTIALGDWRWKNQAARIAA